MMAMGTEQLRLKPLNVEKGSSRFPPREGVVPPPAAAWRNNLAAMSQRRNLLFMAHNQQIYVWEPTGPWQTLGRTPSLILTPVMKDPFARGYISPTVMRHAINHIIVDELGRDEILLLATDSGNVCGYHVETFYSLIERAKTMGETLPIQEPRIEPFLCECVGASAWGLAVHKQARLIAVSCNAHTITVFAFALVDTDGQDAGSDDAETAGCSSPDCTLKQNWVTIKTPTELRSFRDRGLLHRRSHNFRLIYQGHRDNIPSVSFFNYDLVPRGDWMVSVDIANRIIFWNIWKSLHPWNEVDLRAMGYHDRRFDVGERGWSVVALDPRSFRLRRTVPEAVGSRKYRKFADNNELPAIRDVTSSSTVPDSSDNYTYFPPHERDNPDDVLDEFSFPDIFGEVCAIDSAESFHGSVSRKRSLDERVSDDSEDEQREQQTAEDISGTSSISERFPGGSPRRENTADDGVGGPERPMEDGRDEVMEDIRQYIMNIIEHNEPSSDSEDSIGYVVDTLDEILGLPEPGSGEESHQGSDADTISSDEDEDLQTDELETKMVDGWVFPVLQFSEVNIRMIPGPLAERPTMISGPHRQHFSQLPEMMQVLQYYARLNMVKYLPEDGLVVAATQIGRVAIISLAEAHRKGHAFRINWIVPLQSQEKYGDRPLVPLLGMAVSPVQGQERPADDSDYMPARSEHDMSFHYYQVDEDGSPTRAEGGGHRTDSGLSTVESNASINYHHKPRERWHGLQSSRRYRLLLIYGDHTVLSYEFWYEWRDSDDMIL